MQVSRTQSGVMKAVSTTGWRCESEAVVDVYAVDIAIPELKIAVEVDGPSHFTRTKPKRRLGPSAMKLRHLTSAGWTVFSMLSDDWDDRHASQEKLNKLRDMILQQAEAKLKATYE